MRNQEKDATMAVFLDLENIALGAKDARYPRFAVGKVLERLLLKGHIVVKKAYCDFDRYKEFKRDLHEAAFELIEIPHVRQSGKNSADIRMVVDALDLCYTKGHLDTFVIMSGDSDFSPLVSKLRENAKTVIGVGVKNSTSDLFINNCDEFIYYDDLVRGEQVRSVAATGVRPVAKSTVTRVSPAKKLAGSSRGSGNGGASQPVATEPVRDTAPEPTAPGDPDELFTLVAGTLSDLREDRDEDDRVWGSMIKQAIKRRKPGFNERFHGFKSFNDVLIEAQKRGLLRLEHDAKSGGYVVLPVE